MDHNLTVRLRNILDKLLPPDLPWKEAGSGPMVITVQKQDIREARVIMALTNPKFIE